MDGLSFNSQFVLYATLAGLIGAAGMTIVIAIVGKAGWTRANLIMALGYLFSDKRGTAFMMGFVVHLIAGIVFAMIYAALFLLIGLETPVLVIAGGAVLGFLHGVVASLIFVVGAVLGDGGDEIKKVKFSGGPTYLVAHVIYGFLVGVILALSPLFTTGA